MVLFVKSFQQNKGAEKEKGMSPALRKRRSYSKSWRAGRTKYDAAGKTSRHYIHFHFLFITERKTK